MYIGVCGPGKADFDELYMLSMILLISSNSSQLLLPPPTPDTLKQNEKQTRPKMGGVGQPTTDRMRNDETEIE
jgi:hypothetical protein